MSQSSSTISVGSSRTVRTLAYVIVVLASVASSLGLLVPEVYRDNAWVTAQNRGTDLITLLVIVPATVLALGAEKRGSPRGRLVLFGLIGYFFYVYTGASFAYTFNYLFLVYVALFSLSLFALITLGSHMNASLTPDAFDDRTPWRATALFMLWLAVMLCIIWLGQIFPFFWTGEVPEGIRMAGAQTMYVYVLDLGMIVPVAVLGAVWVRCRRDWGPVLAAFILIKAATIGLALLAMTWFLYRAGEPVEGGLALLWSLIALTGLIMSYWFLKHCRTVGNLTDHSRGR